MKKDNYSAICLVCNKRYGETDKEGERELELGRCEKCTGKQSSRMKTANGYTKHSYGRVVQRASTRFYFK